ncbi:MAG TPA: Gmad2 immunoglobulin-like domain-containing protein [Nocardioidaceae bacterium]|nr:Gmad2 immunoglobulin-like domain-containing protein [Nocardioidaceae bacterium]
MNDDEDLRRLFEDAVSDVEPRDSLGSIHARTKERTMSSKRSWLLGAGAAVVATAATVAAVTVLSGDSTTDEPGFAGPTAASNGTSEAASPTPSEEPSATGSAVPETATVPVYYLGETTRGPRLYREFHRVELLDDDPVSTAVSEAVAVPPDDPDYRSPWPGGTTAATVEEPPSDVITVDVRGPGLRERPEGMSAEEAELAIEQLVYTAQAAAQKRAPVQLLLDGNRTDTLLGVPVSEPLAQGAAEDVLAQVWIIDPAEGAEVTSPFEVSGLAAAFEANVVWELRDGDKVVEKGFTTARACCKMEPYSFEVSAPPGEYTLIVTDSDPSGGEGFGPWEDTKQVTILP